MRKFFMTTILLSVLIISACSSTNGTYTKDLKKAKELMDEQTYGEAIEVLENLIENVIPGDDYEHGRLLLVEELKSDAEYMEEHFAELENKYEIAMELYDEAIASDPINLSLYIEAMRSLDNAIEALVEIEDSKMYKDLVAAKDDLTEKLEAYANTIQDEIDKSLAELDFTTAEEKLNELREFSYEFYDIVSDGVVAEYEEKIQEERDRFVYVPETILEWNEVIHESDAGTIGFSGIREVDNTIEVFVTYTGDYDEITDSIDFEPSIILSNGDKVNGSIESNRKYEDKLVRVYQFSSYDEFSIDEIVRFDVEIPMVQEKALQIDFAGVDEAKTTEIEGIESIKEVHRPDWDLKAKDYEVVVDKLFVDKYEIEISGVIKPEKDLTIVESSSAYLPFTDERSNANVGFFGSSSEIDIYKGTEKEFEITHSFSAPISEFNHELKLLIYGQNIHVNLLDGSIIEDAGAVSITEFTGSRNSEYVGFLDSEQKELLNQSDKRVAIDSVIYDGSYSTTSTYNIGNDFKKFETTVHVHKDYSGVDYGTTELTIYVGKGDDEEEVYSKVIEEDHKPLDISVDVKKADYLKIETKADSGDKGTQKLILESPIVK